jgi:hypothetical protein
MHGAVGVLAILRKAWNDSVWSKVIAGGITAALAAIGSLAVSHWHDVSGTAAALAAALASTVSVPVWVLALVGGSVAGLVLALWRRRADPVEIDIQPNAVPVARIGPPFLVRPFEDLSERQQQFLAQQFRFGRRVFSVATEDRRAQWLEELEAWNYVLPPQPYASGTSSFQIGEAAWQELERLRRENGIKE